jgi:hypothetical protein
MSKFLEKEESERERAIKEYRVEKVMTLVRSSESVCVLHGNRNYRNDVTVFRRVLSRFSTAKICI